VFAEIGRVPGVLVFDSATGVGHRFGREVTMTQVFNAFQAHYRIGEVRFRNPYSGNGKGGVENAVGFLRRNLMVPLPKAESLQASARAPGTLRDAGAATALPQGRRDLRPVRAGRGRDARDARRRVRSDALGDQACK
jgi:transposase